MPRRAGAAVGRLGARRISKHQPIRLAIFGAGLIGRNHAALAQASDEVDLVGLCDPEPRALAAAARLGVPMFDKAETLVDIVQPDAAIVATPNDTHAALGTQLAARGLDLLVEKPIATSLADARRLTDACAEAGVALLVGHRRRHSPLVEAARTAVAGGSLGRLTAVSATCMLLKPDSYFAAAPWRTRPAGGPVAINLSHDIDTLRFICGEIARVHAETSAAARGHAVEDSAAVVLRFAGGALGTLVLSDATPSPYSWELSAGENPLYAHAGRDCYRFFGTEGSLDFPTMTLWRYDGGGEPGWATPLATRQLDVAAADPLERQLRHFAAVVRGEATPVIDGADAARTLAVTLAVTEAARSGRPVEI